MSRLPSATPPEAALHTRHIHTLVLLYLAVAYGADTVFDPAERRAVIDLVRRWFTYLEPATVEGIVDTAFIAARANPDLEALTAELGDALTPALRHRVLADLGVIARADGSLSVDEAQVIARIRHAWG